MPQKNIDLHICDFPRRRRTVRAVASIVIASVVAAVMIAGVATQVFAQTPAPGASAVQAFERATRDYAEMHRRLESQIGTIHLNITVAELNRILGELAVAIRVERAQAKQGDFFTPALATELRTRIDHALAMSGFTANDVRDSAVRDTIDPSAFVLRVNETFPWALATGMFPCVVAALPSLPPELQYRIVNDDLILVDVHASLVVDILRNALVDRTAGILSQPGEKPAPGPTAERPNVQ